MTYRVMFEDAWYKRHDVAICDNMDAAWQAIGDYLKDIGVKAYYYRSWKNDNNELTIDYGSHSNFFIVQEMFS